MRNLLVFSMDLPSNSVYHQVLTESIFIPRKKAISFQKASTKPTTFSHFFTEAYLEFIIQVKHKFNVFYFPLDPKLLQRYHLLFERKSFGKHFFFQTKPFCPVALTLKWVSSSRRFSSEKEDLKFLRNSQENIPYGKKLVPLHLQVFRNEIL